MTVIKSKKRKKYSEKYNIYKIIISRKQILANTKMKLYEFPQVVKFKYLGYLITKLGDN